MNSGVLAGRGWTGIRRDWARIGVDFMEASEANRVEKIRYS
jgi:hypothetical protein